MMQMMMITYWGYGSDHTLIIIISIQLILILVGQLSSKKPHWPLGFPSSLRKVPTEIVAAFVAKQQVLSWKYFSC